MNTERWWCWDGDESFSSGGLWWGGLIKCAVMLAVGERDLHFLAARAGYVLTTRTGLFLIELSSSCYQWSRPAKSEERLKQRFPIWDCVTHICLHWDNISESTPIISISLWFSLTFTPLSILTHFLFKHPWPSFVHFNPFTSSLSRIHSCTFMTSYNSSLPSIFSLALSIHSVPFKVQFCHWLLLNSNQSHRGFFAHLLIYASLFSVSTPHFPILFVRHVAFTFLAFPYLFPPPLPFSLLVSATLYLFLS